jgi:hypothetical protein
MASAAGATAASLVGAPGRLLAQAAVTPLPSAPSYTRKVGRAEVSVLLDGHFLLEQAWINIIEPATVASGLEAAYLDPTSALPLPITAYACGDPVRNSGPAATIQRQAFHVMSVMAPPTTDRCRCRSGRRTAGDRGQDG